MADNGTNYGLRRHPIIMLHPAYLNSNGAISFRLLRHVRNS